MKNEVHIHLTEPPEQGCLELLQDRLDPVTRLTTGSVPAGSVHILVDGNPKREHMDICRELRAVIIPWAGVSDETRLLLKDYPQISVYNLHHNAAPTAELAMALMLSAAKHVVLYDQAMRRHDWSPRYQQSTAFLLDGKHALVLGFGAIGQRIGRACYGLGMKIFGIRRNPHKSLPLDYPAEIYGIEALKDLLPKTHALLIALPGTPDTFNLIGETELALMPAGSLLVNVGRGPIVNQKALYLALKSGHLGAAGLDVWYNYPTDDESQRATQPADHPFHELDNIVFSPHRGGASDESERLRMEHLAILLNSLAQGETPPTPVNLEAGY